MNGFVLDCSVAAAWFFPDENSAYADAVMESADANQPVAPSLLNLEFLNAMLAAERRGKITQVDTARCVADLDDVNIEIDPAGLCEPSVLLRLARKHSLSVYDAAYLELSQRRGLPIATLDDGLRSAAQTEGAKLYEA